MATKKIQKEKIQIETKAPEINLPNIASLADIDIKKFNAFKREAIEPHKAKVFTAEVLNSFTERSLNYIVESKQVPAFDKTGANADIKSLVVYFPLRNVQITNRAINIRIPFQWSLPAIPNNTSPLKILSSFFPVDKSSLPGTLFKTSTSEILQATLASLIKLYSLHLLAKEGTEVPAASLLSEEAVKSIIELVLNNRLVIVPTGSPTFSVRILHLSDLFNLSAHEVLAEADGSSLYCYFQDDNIKTEIYSESLCEANSLHANSLNRLASSPVDNYTVHLRNKSFTRVSIDATTASKENFMALVLSNLKKAEALYSNPDEFREMLDKLFPEDIELYFDKSDSDEKIRNFNTALKFNENCPTSILFGRKDSQKLEFINSTLSKGYSPPSPLFHIYSNSPVVNPEKPKDTGNQVSFNITTLPQAEASISIEDKVVAAKPGFTGEVNLPDVPEALSFMFSMTSGYTPILPINFLAWEQKPITFFLDRDTFAANAKLNNVTSSFTFEMKDSKPVISYYIPNMNLELFILTHAVVRQYVNQAEKLLSYEEFWKTYTVPFVERFLNNEMDIFTASFLYPEKYEKLRASLK
jgi:hypothetical protein